MMPAKLMVVEDNPDEVRLMREGLRLIKFDHELEVAEDVDSALELLVKKQSGPQPSYPDLILLDLRLPGKEGVELLTELKKHPELKRLPVIIYSTSKSENDIARCYDQHANAYITKPIGLQELLKCLEMIRKFWFEIVTLPKIKQPA